MKGLIRNNFYALGGNLMAAFVISGIIMVVAVVAGIYFSNHSAVTVGIIGAQLGCYGALAGVTVQKNSISKWDKFELTMPVSRADVIKARYISFMLYILIGLVMAACSALLLAAVSGALDMERVGYAFAFGFGFAILLQAFLHPMILWFGSDKNEYLLVVSVLLSMGMFAGTGALLSPLLNDFSNANFLFRGGYVVFGLLLFLASYFVSLAIYRKKEV